MSAPDAAQSAEKRALPEPRLDPLPCEKCGWDEIDLRYCTWLHQRDFQRISVQGSSELEHIDAVCQRCHFTWRMEVLRPKPHEIDGDDPERDWIEGERGYLADAAAADAPSDGDR